MKNIFKNKKLSLMIWLAVLSIVMILAFAEHIVELKGKILYIQVEENRSPHQNEDSLRPVIRSFGTAAVIKEYPNLKVDDDHFLLKVFAPGNKMLANPVYVLFGFITCIIFFVRIKKLNLEKPFSPQMLNGLNWVTFLALAFAFADSMRLSYINKYIINVTDGLYRTKTSYFFDSPLSWIAISLTWLSTTFRKAKVLQQEQELTV